MQSSLLIHFKKSGVQLVLDWTGAKGIKTVKVIKECLNRLLKRLCSIDGVALASGGFLIMRFLETPQLLIQLV